MMLRLELDRPVEMKRSMLALVQPELDKMNGYYFDFDTGKRISIYTGVARGSRRGFKSPKHVWGSDRVNMLLGYVDEGYSVKEIVAKSQTFSENAIRCKLWKLGYIVSDGRATLRNS